MIAPSPKFSMAAFHRASLRRSASSARRFSVTSWKTRTTPDTCPAASRIGAALSSIGIWRPLLGHQRRVIGQGDDAGVAQHGPDDVVGRLSGQFVDDPEDTVDRLPHSVLEFPSRQRDGLGIEEANPALGIHGHDGVADARERDAQPFLAQPQRLLRLLALGDVAVAFQDEHLAVADAAGGLAALDGDAPAVARGVESSPSQRPVVVQLAVTVPPPSAPRCAAASAGPGPAPRRRTSRRAPRRRGSRSG